MIALPDNSLSFKISAGLKNIIGRDLITDDFIAVFELVKNSFDAYAKNVTIEFLPDKIIIADDGKGMDLNDLNEKWLFVAYSAKKDGKEDDELNDEKFASYRDKIQEKKFYAGAKGIGRFSCDRLGSKLTLTTKKALKDSKIEQIDVNWKDFETDPNAKFVDIKVKHRELAPTNKAYEKLKNGTILEITNLNSSWDRGKKQNLIHSLEKLINPFEENSLNGFAIIVKDASELNNDKEEKIRRNKVNGQVKNFILETLNVKTTQIVTEINNDGEYIETTLHDRGTLIYKVRKVNNTHPKLTNIKFHLFHLNRSAKVNFKKLMGIEPVNFGSIFIYKHGFRIAPYGDVGYDYFGLDTRKSQKHFQRLGSRDLIGRIEIIGENPDFKEISSRDGGLVRNDHYNAMIQCFISLCLVKLENYVSKVQWTNKEDKDKDDLSALNNIKAQSALLKLVSDEVDEDDATLLDADREHINLRTRELLKESSDKDIEALKIIAQKLGDHTFSAQTDNTASERLKILELQTKLESEEAQRRKAEDDKKRLEDDLEREKEKNTYLRTSSRTLSEDAKGLVHNIKITTKAINSNVDTLYDKVKSGKLKNEEILRRLGIIKFNADKALKISRLITRSNFRAQQNEQIVDIVKYISQYMAIYSDIYEKNQLQFDIILNDATFVKKVSLLDISVVLDDLISNSEKANASLVQIETVNPTDESLLIYFSDNGRGVSERFLENSEQIFELGVTTTEGSGIGLNSVRTALKSMNGSIEFLGNNLRLGGATFQISF